MVLPKVIPLSNVHSILVHPKLAASHKNTEEMFWKIENDVVIENKQWIMNNEVELKLDIITRLASSHKKNWKTILDEPALNVHIKL